MRPRPRTVDFRSLLHRRSTRTEPTNQTHLMGTSHGKWKDLHRLWSNAHRLTVMRVPIEEDRCHTLLTIPITVSRRRPSILRMLRLRDIVVHREDGIRLHLQLRSNRFTDLWKVLGRTLKFSKRAPARGRCCAKSFHGRAIQRYDNFDCMSMDEKRFGAPFLHPRRSFFSSSNAFWWRIATNTSSTRPRIIRLNKSNSIMH